MLLINKITSINKKSKNFTRNIYSHKFFIITLFLGLFVFNNPKILTETNSSELPDKGYLYKENKNEYLIGPGDVLRISINRYAPELTNNYTIDAEGKINLVELNRIYIEGLTLEELTNLLNEEFSKYVKFPQIEIQIIKYRPVFVYVDGEIESPGLYKLDGSINILSSETDLLSPDRMSSITGEALPISDQSSFPTLFDAIKKAGGINRFSDLSKIEVVRKNSISSGGGYKKATINFLSVINNGDLSQNIRLFDGDTIKINKSKETNLIQISKAIRSNLNPKFINVAVAGRVERPGTITITKSSTLNMALDLSGGTKVIKGDIVLHRIANNGTLEKRKFRFKKNAKKGSNSNPFLKDGDIIFVNKGAIYASTEVLNDISRPFTGILSSILLYEALQDAL